MPPRFARLFFVLCLSVLVVPVVPIESLASGSEENDPKHDDLSGDPLPSAAIARLGSTRFRGERFHLSPDNTILATEHRDGVHLCDASTGRVLLHVRKEDEYHIQIGAFSPNSKLLTTLSSRGRECMLRVWDAITRCELWRSDIKFPNSPNVAFSRDSRMLISWGADETVRSWEAVTGKLIRKFNLPRKPDWYRTALSPDGAILAACSDEHTVCLWRVSSGEKLWTLDANRPINQVVFSSDASVLGVATREGIRFWDVSTGRERSSALRNGPTGGEFSSDWRTLVVSGDHLQSLAAWDVATGRRLWEKQYEYQVRDSALSPDGQGVAVLYDEALLLLDVRTGKIIRRMEGRITSTWLGFFCKIAFSADGRWILARDGETIRRWSVATGKEYHATPGHTDTVQTLRISADGKTLASGGADGMVCVWDTTSGKLLRRLRGPETVLLVCTALSADGRTVATAGWIFDPSFRVWDVESGRLLYEFRQAREPVHKGEYGVTAAFSPDGQTLAVASQATDVIHLRHARAGGQLRILKQEASIMGLAFSPGGRILSAYPDGDFGRINLWDMDTSAAMKPLPPRSGGSCVFSPDGKLMVTTSETRLWVWELMTRQKPFTLETAGWFVAATFTPTGRVLALEAPEGHRSPSWDFVNVWDVCTRRRLVRLQVPGNRLHSIAFSPDGRRIATSMDDTSILIWDLERLGLRDKREPVELDAKELDRLWNDLASVEARCAYRAMQTMLATPDKTITHLRSHLLADTDRSIARLLVELDDADGRKRQSADAELTRLGRRIEPALRAALRDRPSLEMRRRVETLLLKVNEQQPDAEVLRRTRAVHMLECLDVPATREFLQTLARGARGGFTTEEAISALKRATRNSDPEQ